MKKQILFLAVMMMVVAAPAIPAYAATATGGGIEVDIDHPPTCSIICDPASAIVFTGDNPESATFTCTAAIAEPDDGTISYQWYFNAVPITGSTTSVLNIAQVYHINEGQYLCRATNSRGLSKDSNVIALTVYNKLKFVEPPVSQNVAVGGNIILDVLVFGESPYTYQWFKDGTDPGNAITAPSSDSQLVISNAQLADAGSYYCYVTDNVSQADFSPPAIVTVGLPKPEFLFTHVSGTQTASLVVNQHNVALVNQVMSPGLVPASPTIAGVLMVVDDGGLEYVARKTVTVPADGNSASVTFAGATDFYTWDGDPVAIDLAKAGLKVATGYTVNPGALDLKVDPNKCILSCNGTAMSIDAAPLVNWIP